MGFVGRMINCCGINESQGHVACDIKEQKYKSSKAVENIRVLELEIYQHWMPYKKIIVNTRNRV